MVCPIPAKDLLDYHPENGIEIWSQVPNCPSQLWISSYGRTFNTITGELKEVTNQDTHGYHRFKMNQKTYYIHRLMGIAWLGVKSKNVEVHHIDENKSNNLLCNLKKESKVQHAKMHYERVKHKLRFGINKPVFARNLQTNQEIFLPSINEAANFAGISSRQLSGVMNQKSRYPIRGWVFRFGFFPFDE